MRTPAALLALAAAAPALAQPCTPAWNGAPGNPGATSGYIQPILAWDEGAGQRLFVGGSFTNGGGAGIQYLARYNPATNAWSRVGGGINPGPSNAFLTSITTFAPQTGAPVELVVGGFFDNAINPGGVNVPGTQSIARWNGTRWADLGANLVRPNAVWSLLTRNIPNGQILFVGGSFPAIGGQPGVGVASYDGATWTPLATTITGFSPTVFALADFNDGSGNALYAAGRFTALNGAGPNIARWNGTSWSSVGSGIVPSSSTGAINAITVFDDGSGPALYIGGNQFSVNGVLTSVAKWNGSTWTPVGQPLGGAVWSLAAFNDGSGNALHLGGSAQPGSGFVSKLVGNTWTPLAGGATGSVFGLRPIGDSLWVGGSFSAVAGGATTAFGLAAYRGCTAPACPGSGPNACGPGDWNEDGVIDFNDLLAFLNDYNAVTPCSDVNADGTTDFNDLLEYLNRYNTPC